MTTDAAPASASPAPKSRRRRRTVLAVILVLVTVSAGYLAHYGQCESRSKFCIVDIAGTRSEIGFEWDSWAFYVSTYPAEPVT